LASAALPPVSRKRSGRPSPYVSAWSLLVRPPRLIPIAWRSAPFSTRSRAVRLHMGAVDKDLGRRSARRRQSGEQLPPDALLSPAREAVVESFSRSLAGRRIDPAPARLPGVMMKAARRPRPSTSACNLVVAPPRARPMALACAPLSHQRPSDLPWPRCCRGSAG
jgi:hypothetical protein